MKVSWNSVEGNLRHQVQLRLQQEATILYDSWRVVKLLPEHLGNTQLKSVSFVPLGKREHDKR